MKAYTPRMPPEKKPLGNTLLFVFVLLKKKVPAIFAILALLAWLC
jgi:hypothetical protein